MNRALLRRPAFHTHTQYTDVFLALPVAHQADTHRVRVPAFVLETFRKRLSQLISRRITPVTVTWVPNGKKAVASAPLQYARPAATRPLLPCSGRSKHWKDVLSRTLRTVMQGKVVSPAADAAFSQHFGKRTADQLEAANKEWQTVQDALSTRPPPKRRRLRRLDESQ